MNFSFSIIVYHTYKEYYYHQNINDKLLLLLLLLTHLSFLLLCVFYRHGDS